jgi:hypothetical protein
MFRIVGLNRTHISALVAYGSFISDFYEGSYRRPNTIKNYCLLWNPKVRYHVQSSPALDVILSHMTPIYILTCSFRDFCNTHLRFMHAVVSLAQSNRVINGKATVTYIINKLPLCNLKLLCCAHKNLPLDPSLTLKSISSDPISSTKEVAFVKVKWTELTVVRFQVF